MCVAHLTFFLIKNLFDKIFSYVEKEGSCVEVLFFSKRYIKLKIRYQTAIWLQRRVVNDLGLIFFL